MAPAHLFRAAIRLTASKAIWVFITLCVTSSSSGQGNFTPRSDARLSPWSPPPATPTDSFEARPAVEHQPVTGFSAESNFPSEPHAFDPNIRTAQLDVPASETTVSADATIDSTLDSTATMFANLKDATTDKLSGLMGTLDTDGGWSQKLQSLTGSADIGKMLGSLALVLGIYFAFVWAMRKLNPNGNKGLPPGVIEVMGQVPFGTRRNLQLVRLGSKLLLLMNSPEGTQPIGEITNPTEVEYLASLCPGNRKQRANSANHIAAIQQAAKRLGAPNPQAAAATPTTTNNSNLANILRTLEQAANPNGNVFEA